MRKLSVPEKHQLAIAKKTLKMTAAAVFVLGRPTKKEARDIIEKLTGKRPKEAP